MNISLLHTIEEKKFRLDHMRPLPAAQLKNLEEWYKVELTYTSNAIEGNTLTRAETAMVVEKGITIKGKSLNEHLEATNHAHALDYVKSLVGKKRQEITKSDVLNIHSVILQSIDNSNSGVYRKIPVRISGSAVVLAEPLKVPELMEEFFAWLQGNNSDHIIKVAADAHYKLVTIHPFTDGNGRTARLLMNLILMQAGYPPAIIRPEYRPEYIESLEKAQLGEISLDRFYEFIFESVNNSLDVYLGEDDSQVPLLRTVSLDKQLINRKVLSDLTGIRPSTIKFYTEQGLLQFHQEEGGLRRFYDRDTSLARLEKIKKLKDTGLSIEEVRDKLGS